MISPADPAQDRILIAPGRGYAIRVRVIWALDQHTTEPEQIPVGTGKPVPNVALGSERETKNVLAAYNATIQQITELASRERLSDGRCFSPACNDQSWINGMRRSQNAGLVDSLAWGGLAQLRREIDPIEGGA